MVSLRPVLLIGVLVAVSGVLVHQFWADEKSDPDPHRQRDAAGADVRPTPADPPATPTPASGEPPVIPDAAKVDDPAAAGAPGRAAEEREPAPEQTAAAVRSRLDPAPSGGRSAEDQVPGQPARAAVEHDRQALSAERAATSESRSSVPSEPAAAVAPDPVAEATARDAGSGSAPAELAAAPPERGTGTGATSEATSKASLAEGEAPGELPDGPGLRADRDRVGDAGASDSGPRAADAAAPGEPAEAAGRVQGWGDFGISMLRRSIGRLFGTWTGDESVDQPSNSAPVPSDMPDRSMVADRDPPAPAAEASDPGQLTSKSEASIRQAVRAMVALEEIEPGAGPGGRAEEADEDGGPAGPSFDIVRVEPSGSAVIAGRAKPGTEVEVRVGDDVLDRVKADRSGAWVSTPAKPLPAGDQTLSLAALEKDGTVVRSEDVVVVAIRETPPPAPVAKPEPPPPQPPARVIGEAPPPQPAEIVPAVAPAEPLAVLLPREGQGRILQAPGRISSGGRLALNVVDYDLSGRVELSGEAPPGAAIRIYVDNQPAAEVVAAESGAWTTVLEDRLGPGTYTLRLDQLDPSGRPVARLETPFTRVAEPPRDGDLEVDYVIVQPGNSLWRIARRLSGRGMSYVHIFDANRGQIRDPDLIYPGQVFEIPAGFGSAG